VAAELRTHHPESFRAVSVTCRNGEDKQLFVFTKTVRLKKYGRKRLVVVHEQEDLTDELCFLLTNALHWESGRVIQTWSYRWPYEIFHEFNGTQTAGQKLYAITRKALQQILHLVEQLLPRGICVNKVCRCLCLLNILTAAIAVSNSV